MTRTTIAAGLAAAATALAAAGTAAAAGGDNTAIAVNTRDGSTVYTISFAIRRLHGETVDATNAAVAAAGCSDCQTVAIALEALLIFTEPTTFTPANIAIAENVRCSSCQTLASATQIAVETWGPVHFTADGNRRVAEIRRQLQQLRQSDLSIWDAAAVVDRLSNELLWIVQNELVPAGRS